MSYEPKIAEIYTEDSETDDINLWSENSVEKLEKKSENQEEITQRLLEDILPGSPAGLRYMADNKNEVLPGHEHLFPPRDKTIVYSFFESKDGWATGGVGTEVITPQIGGLSLTTGASTNDDAWILATTTGFNSFDVSQASAFQTVLKFSSAASITAYWGVGDITAGGAFGAANEEGYGFKYVSGTLSALTVKNGAETLTTINNITATNFNEYRAIFDGRAVNFFVNGRNVATHRAGIADTDDDIFATFYVKTTTTAAKTMYARYLYFVQLNT